jgi:hypothetical protein
MGAAMVAGVTAESASLVGAPYKNASLPIEERVADLIARMTPTELVGQLLHTMGVPNDYNYDFIRNQTLQWGGIGGGYWCYTLCVSG